MKPVTKEKALDRLTSLCAKSEQCEYDLQRKMILWGLNSADRKEVIDYLKENRFLDNERFAKKFVSDKAVLCHWGPFKIRKELIKRRINSGLISVALQEIEQEVWKKGLLKVAGTKSASMDLIGEEGWENRQKLLRYLVSRGFPGSSCSKAVSLMKKKQEESETLD